MASRLVVGRCLCTYTRLYGSRSLSSTSRALQRQLPCPSSSTVYRATGCNLQLPNVQPVSRLHTSRWLASDAVEFNEPSKDKGYLYAKSHEWALVKDNIATIGISNYAQEKLGDAVFVELPDMDTEFVQGDQFGVLESVKAAADVYSPLSGTVIEVNTQLEEEPENINKDSYGDGWIIKLELSEDSGSDKLMDVEAYEQHVKESV